MAARTAQLESVNKELEAFAYSVSHDLRAPLRAMEGFSTALLTRYQDQLDEQGQHYLVRIQQASQRMGQLINDMLTLSRIARTELRAEPVDLGLLTGEITAEIQSAGPGAAGGDRDRRWVDGPGGRARCCGSPWRT